MKKVVIIVALVVCAGCAWKSPSTLSTQSHVQGQGFGVSIGVDFGSIFDSRTNSVTK